MMVKSVSHHVSSDLRELRSGEIHIAVSPFVLLYSALVFNLPQTRHCDFTIRCKNCGENIPAPVGTMPDTWIAAQCPLCGAKRSYLPSEIFRGKLSYKLGPKPVRSVVR